MNDSKCRAALLRVSGLTRLDDIGEALSGRRKYNPDTLEPIPYSGLSVIHQFGREDRERLGLGQILRALRYRLQQDDLTSRIAVVSDDSLHVTTFDLTNAPRHKHILEAAGFDYAAVQDQITKATDTYVWRLAPRLNGPATLGHIDMFPPAAVIRPVSIHPAFHSIFRVYRTGLNCHLCETVSGYDQIRDASWAEEFTPHVTLAYLVNPMTAPQVDRFLAALHATDDDLDPTTMQLTQGVVTAFSDMEHYRPVSRDAPYA